MSEIKEDNQEKSLDTIKEKKGIKFINIIKKKWLISGSKTLILVAMLIAAFILITYGMQKLELTPIDLTSNKVYTVSDESKEKISKVEKNINVYLIGFNDDDSSTVIAKQYQKTNDKINVEAIDIKQRTDIADKYEIKESDTTAIIVECGARFKVLSSMDLTTYDTNTYQSIDVTEEKLTSAIMNVTTEDVPNVYFLTNYSNISLSSGMNYLKAYLENEIMNVDTVDILAQGKVPDDCDTLVIISPQKDFEDIVTESIINYINKGGNILWFNFAYPSQKNLTNVNKVLATYGVEPFSVGYIMETDNKKMISGAPYMILPDVQSSKATEKSPTILMVQPTKINILETEKLTELNVEKEALLYASTTSFFRTNIASQSTTKTDQDEAGDFIVGAQLTKKIKDDTKSILIIYGDTYFISDTPISGRTSTPVIASYYNKDLASFYYIH